MKIFSRLFLMILAISVIACDPYQDQFEEIEENAPGPVANISITLEESHYELLEDIVQGEDTLIVDNYVFYTEDQVRTYIPEILAQEFPLFDNGSAVNVTYNFFGSTAEDVEVYKNAEEYEVATSDYAQLGGDAATYSTFTAEQPAKGYIPQILADSLSSAEEGELRIVTYNYVDEVTDPSENIVMAEADYQSLVDFIEIELGTDWLNSFGSLDYYYGSNSFFENFDGRVDTRKGWIADNNLNDSIFDGNTTIEEDSLDVEARIQEGIVKYLELNYPNATAQVGGIDKFFYINYLVFYGGSAGSIDYYVKYQADGDGSFELIEGPSTAEISSSTESDFRGDFYQYDGSAWEKVEDAYYLNASDYDAMGAPGRFNNFSESTPAEDYLPKLLSQVYPFATEGEEKVVVYQYYAGRDFGTLTRGDLYTFTNGMWDRFEANLQFGKEENVWVPDNTIAYELTGADYNTIGNIEIENGNTARGENVIQFGNFYQNFPGGDTHWEDSEIYSILGQFLKQKFPDAAVGQKYLITYSAYVGSNADFSVKLILTESGDYEVVE